jgi:hypothetical protein
MEISKESDMEEFPIGNINLPPGVKVEDLVGSVDHDGGVFVEDSEKSLIKSILSV